MFVCKECGVTANVLRCLKTFGKPPKKLMFDLSTWHKGICAVCGEKKDLTEDRDYFYPDFDLLKRRTIYIKK